MSGNQAQRQEDMLHEQGSQCVIGVVQEIYREILWILEYAGAECTLGIA